MNMVSDPKSFTGYPLRSPIRIPPNFQLLSLGYAYHLTDDQIADWHRMARACDGDETSIDRLVAYFDRIVESIATIPGYFVTRSPIWVKLLCDINSAYHEMMRNPDWIADLDSALERGSPRRE